MQPLRSFELGRKAQTFSSEFILAYIIFLLVLTAILFLWDTTNRSIITSERLYDMENSAINAVEKLIRTPGMPNDWFSTSSTDDIISIGLANKSRILDERKVLKFIELMSTSGSSLCPTGIIGSNNYNCSRYLLGLGKYEFYFELMDINGTVLNLNGTQCATGNSPHGDYEYMLTIWRSAILNDEIVKIKFVVWK
ncbi:MAG: hypothetical protein DRO94_04810 [Candidatus Altiarchaeales archaeon]|nr:MAG: hypothetical protein DRO95_05765 [Candidatus Altiarchaeales archaeon]RLI93610.1 MAG: hypothetical protein DRO94_04810 [Candidatus Altiarchaeales archaeon]HDO82876.1 hypothetical protein [Candidatus Altiarchaeales archaeon]HEX55525.1 hypothetical protein [Candidatus Altiarchaeales archaeon]